MLLDFLLGFGIGFCVASAYWTWGNDKKINEKLKNETIKIIEKEVNNDIQNN